VYVAQKVPSTRSECAFPHYVANCHKVVYNPLRMLKSYLPVLVFLLLGLGVGVAFTMLNAVLGPKRPSKVKRQPYECGLPSEVTRNFRFGISFYLIAMLFILFDIEVVFLYPVAVQLEAFGVFALIETAVFIALLLVAFVFVWRRGALEWR
jgi:NADH-quinone oxidoreductase subunit A